MHPGQRHGACETPLDLTPTWGTVENVPAGSGLEERKRNPRNTLLPLVPMNRRKPLFHMVFITIGEPQAHDDRLAICGRLPEGLAKVGILQVRQPFGSGSL